MNRSIHKIIEEQIKRWELLKPPGEEEAQKCTIVTISRERGSQGYQVAEKLAQTLGFDLFHNEILEAMIETSKSSKALVETLDEKAMNVIDDIVADLIHKHHLWPDDYSKLLLKIMNTIGKHGNAVVLGRGGNFALENTNALKVRIVAPEAVRQKHIQHTMDLNAEDAANLMISTDANRVAFVRRYFNEDATDPSNYDLVLNTGTLSVEKTVDLIQRAIR